MRAWLPGAQHRRGTDPGSSTARDTHRQGQAGTQLSSRDAFLLVGEKHAEPRPRGRADTEATWWPMSARVLGPVCRLPSVSSLWLGAWSSVASAARLCSSTLLLVPLGSALPLRRQHGNSQEAATETERHGHRRVRVPGRPQTTPRCLCSPHTRGHAERGTFRQTLVEPAAVRSQRLQLRFTGVAMETRHRGRWDTVKGLRNLSLSRKIDKLT